MKNKTTAKKIKKVGSKKKTAAASPKSAGKPIGQVTHFYGGLKVAIVKFKKPVKVGSGVYFNRPEPAEVSFLFLSVSELETPSVEKALFGLSEFGLSGPHKTLGMF